MLRVGVGPRPLPLIDAGGAISSYHTHTTHTYVPKFVTISRAERSHTIQKTPTSPIKLSLSKRRHPVICVFYNWCCMYVCRQRVIHSTLLPLSLDDDLIITGDDDTSMLGMRLKKDFKGISKVFQRWLKRLLREGGKMNKFGLQLIKS